MKCSNKMHDRLDEMIQQKYGNKKLCSHKFGNDKRCTEIPHLSCEYNYRKGEPLNQNYNQYKKSVHVVRNLRKPN